METSLAKLNDVERTMLRVAQQVRYLAITIGGSGILSDTAVKKIKFSDYLVYYFGRYLHFFSEALREYWAVKSFVSDHFCALKAKHDNVVSVNTFYYCDIGFSLNYLLDAALVSIVSVLDDTFIGIVHEVFSGISFKKLRKYRVVLKALRNHITHPDSDRFATSCAVSGLCSSASTVLYRISADGYLEIKDTVTSRGFKEESALILPKNYDEICEVIFRASDALVVVLNQIDACVKLEALENDITLSGSDFKIVIMGDSPIYCNSLAAKYGVKEF